MRRLLLIGAALVLCGHSWYDGSCCSDQDCFHEDKDGFIVEGHIRPGGHVVSYKGVVWNVDEKDVKRSQDGDYHICINTGTPSPDNRPKCIYAPMAGL